jgi:hypothetical protein
VISEGGEGEAQQYWHCHVVWFFRGALLAREFDGGGAHHGLSSATLLSLSDLEGTRSLAEAPLKALSSQRPRLRTI